MKKYKVTIELLSDCCIGNGQSSGSNIDTDICTNEYGLPYIPAKRLKGLCKDCYLDYIDITNRNDNSVKLFGNEKEKSIFKFTDADLLNNNGTKYIDDFRDKKINLSTEEKLINKSIFTSFRTHTAVYSDLETAKDGSLRNINVINKGNKFQFEIIFNEDDKILNTFKESLVLLNHIGLNRNRGYGLVKTTISEVEDFDNKLNLDFLDTKSNDDNIDVKIKLTNLQPLILSSNDKTKTLSYIPGSTIYGYFASKFAKDNDIDKYSDKKQEFIDLFFGKDALKFTNAYISYDNEESMYVPKFLMKENHTNKVVNILDEYYLSEDESTDCSNEEPENLELKPKRKKFKDAYAKVCIIDNKINFYSREENILNLFAIKYNYNYHHKRNDKNLVSDDGLYEYYSISSYQDFIFHIKGKKKYIKEILKDNKYIFLGKSNSSEYGMCKLEILNNTDIKKVNLFEGSKYLFYFNSDTILYTKEGTPVLTHNKLEDYFKTLSKSNNNDKIVFPNIYQIVDYHIKFVCVGGYNAKWGANKQQEIAIEKGSYFTFICDDDYKGFNTVLNIGKYNNIGFGDCRIISDIESDETADSKKSTDLIYKLTSSYSTTVDKPEYLLDEIKINKNLEEMIDYKPFVPNTVNNTQLGKVILELLRNDSRESFTKVFDQFDFKDMLEKIDDKIKTIYKIDDEIKSYKNYKKAFIYIIKKISYDLGNTKKQNKQTNRGGITNE